MNDHISTTGSTRIRSKVLKRIFCLQQFQGDVAIFKTTYRTEYKFFDPPNWSTKQPNNHLPSRHGAIRIRPRDTGEQRTSLDTRESPTLLLGEPPRMISTHQCEGIRRPHHFKGSTRHVHVKHKLPSIRLLGSGVIVDKILINWDLPSSL